MSQACPVNSAEIYHLEKSLSLQKQSEERGTRGPRVPLNEFLPHGKKHVPRIGKKCHGHGPTITPHFPLCVMMQVLTKESHVRWGQDEKFGDCRELVWAESIFHG